MIYVLVAANSYTPASYNIWIVCNVHGVHTEKYVAIYLLRMCTTLKMCTIVWVTSSRCWVTLRLLSVGVRCLCFSFILSVFVARLLTRSLHFIHAVYLSFCRCCCLDVVVRVLTPKLVWNTFINCISFFLFLPHLYVLHDPIGSNIDGAKRK